MNYKLVEFNTLRYKTKDMIDIVCKCGFDTQKYNSLYNEILENVERKLKVENAKYGVLNGSTLDIIYADAIEKLKTLENDLLKYDIYFKALNLINYVNERLDKEDENLTINKKVISIDKNFNKEQIAYLVDSMIDVLKLIGETSDIDMDNVIIKNLHNIAFQIIKLEVYSKNESRLYDYVKRCPLHLLFINKCVEDELNKLDLTLDKYNKLSLKKLELSSDGLGQDYFDLDMIKLLLNCDNTLSDKVSFELEEEIDAIKKLKVSFDNKISKLSDLEVEFKNDKNAMIDFRELILKKAIALGLALSIVGGAGYGLSRGAKKLATYKRYNRSITTYSFWNGLEQYDDYKLNGTYDDELNLKEYGVWQQVDDNVYEREVKVYDVSNYNFDNLEDYLNYGVENYGISYTLEKESVEGEVHHYSNPYMEVEKIVVDDPFDTVDKGEYIGVTIGFNFILFMFIVLIELMCSLHCTGVFIPNIEDTIIYLEKYRRHKGFCINELNKAKEIILELQGIINSNEELKLEFNKLYEANKCLLDKPEILYKRFEEISSKFVLSNINFENNRIKKLTKGKENC